MPLEGAHQRLVEFNLAVSVIAPVWLAREVPSHSFHHEKIAVFVLLAIAFAPGWLSLWRVRRRRSWLAVSRIPSAPRRRLSS